MPITQQYPILAGRGEATCPCIGPAGNALRTIQGLAEDALIAIAIGGMLAPAHVAAPILNAAHPRVGRVG
jgi:hypothetical protein